MTARSLPRADGGTPSRARRGPGAVPLLAAACITLVVMALGAVAAPTAGAHAELESSDPGNVSTVSEPVERITLRFTKASEPVSEGFAIAGPDGPVEVADVGLSDDGRTMTVEPAQPLADGRFRVTWAIRAGDTHSMNGTIAFTVAAGATAGDATGATPAATTPVDTATTASIEPVVAPGPAVAAERVATALRWLLYTALLLCIGGVVYLSAVHRGPRGETRTFVYAVRRTALALVGVSVLVLVVQLSVVDGGSWLAVFSPSAWGDVLTSGHGPATLLRIVGAGLVLVFFGTTLLPTGTGRGAEPDGPTTGGDATDTGTTALRVRRRRRTDVRVAPSPLAALGVAALVGSEAFLGHTADTTPRALVVTGDAVHLLAAGFWASGVVFLLWSLLRRRAGGGPGLAAVVARFSGLAVVAVAAVAASGIVMGLLILDGPSALFSSTFGRLLLAKTALVAALVTLGAHNRRTLVPAISRPEPDERDLVRFRRALTGEAALFASVLGLTAVLVGSSPV